MVEIRPGGDSQLSKNPEPNKGLSITEQQCKGSGAAVIRELQNGRVRESGRDEGCNTGPVKRCQGAELGGFSPVLASL